MVVIGLTGNDALATRFPYVTEVSMNNNLDWWTGSGTRVNGPLVNIYGNANATWEKSKKLNLGVDMTLLESMDITIDYFKEDRSGIFMQRSSVPVEKLRDKIWVEANGHTVSIMDYARFNYVAQPEDRISEKGLFPRIGDYDKWAIKWGYQYRPEFKDPFKEKAALRAEVTKKLKGDHRLLSVMKEKALTRAAKAKIWATII